MWGDVTSLCVMLEQSTAQYFNRVLLIVSILHTYPLHAQGYNNSLSISFMLRWYRCTNKPVFFIKVAFLCYKVLQSH